MTRKACIEASPALLDAGPVPPASEPTVSAYLLTGWSSLSVCTHVLTADWATMLKKWDVDADGGNVVVVGRAKKIWQAEFRAAKVTVWERE